MAHSKSQAHLNWIAWFTFALLLGGTLFLAIRSKPRVTASRNSCISVLRQLDGAMEQWALENKKPAGHILSKTEEEEVYRYIAGGRTRVICEQGGTYTMPPVGSPPTCSIKTHVLASPP
ncbi:MAG: hypothetical protein SFY81_07580 [Verrucomicrobiota bacterium]|nr:hypothetical protein [Verrucomicrobiota bacterium]